MRRKWILGAQGSFCHLACRYIHRYAEETDASAPRVTQTGHYHVDRQVIAVFSDVGLFPLLGLAVRHPLYKDVKAMNLLARYFSEFQSPCNDL